jgi:hypothetical protein
MAFDTAGWIRLRADYNGGAGGVAFPEPGAIRIGAGALTRAMCPSGSLGDCFARDVASCSLVSPLTLELPVDTDTLRSARQSRMQCGQPLQTFRGARFSLCPWLASPDSAPRGRRLTVGAEHLARGSMAGPRGNR